jgi:carboxypeptidase Taq
MSDTVTTFRERCREIQRLAGVLGLLGWDQEVTMPPRGAATRARQRGALAGLVHERLTAPELGALLDDLAGAGALPDDVAADVRVLGHQRERAVRLPASLVRELAEAVGLAQPDWVAAREHDDWDRFAPHLARIVDLKRREAAELGIGDEPYDALLDEYEPGARTAWLLPVFADLRTALVDLLGRIDATVATLPAGPYPPARQEMLSRDLLAAIGYDLAAGRLDVSAHPFTESPGPGDVRVTSRFVADDLLSGLTATLHEGGHALYEQGLPEHLAELPSGQAVSLGIHESQSLLWENHVGRSRPFCRWLAPRLREAFPTVLAGLDHDALYAALNTVRPGPIRIEADEVHYNLHIVLRLEIERALLTGDLAVRDVPVAWRDRARDLLGLEIADHRTGALQDIHWCMGALGYFPTYTLGKLYAAMLWSAVRRDLPDLDTLLAGGEFEPLLSWLRTHVHARGSVLPAADLCREITGHELRADDFVAYLAGKYVDGA